MKLLKLLLVAGSSIYLGDYFFPNKCLGFLFPVQILLLFGALLFLVIYTIVHIIKYFRNPLARTRFNNILLGYATLFLLVFSLHQSIRYYNDESESLVIAVQDCKIEGRESTVYDFKKNGHLLVEANLKFSTDYYWGSYKRKGDTLIMDIPIDFENGKIAYFKNNQFRFLDDTLHNQCILIRE